MNDKLRECPFCGNNELKIEKQDTCRDNFIINCSNCGLQMWDITEKGLITNWNTRYTNTPKHETVEEWETIKHELAYPKDNELCLYESELGAKFLGYLKNGLWYLNSNNNPIDKPEKIPIVVNNSIFLGGSCI